MDGHDEHEVERDDLQLVEADDDAVPQVAEFEPAADAETPVGAATSMAFDAPEIARGLPQLAALHEPSAQLQDWDMLLALADAAGRTRTDLAAAGLAAAMVPLALRLVPSLDRALWPALPTLVRGSMALAVQMRRRPDEAGYRLGLIPLVLRRTVAMLARDVADGRPLPGHEHLLQLLEAQARRVLAEAPWASQPRNPARGPRGDARWP